MIVLLEKLDVFQQKTPREVFRDGEIFYLEGFDRLVYFSNVITYINE